MNEADVLDFVELLNQPAPVRFVTGARAPGLIVRAALISGVVFVWNTLRCFLGVAPASAPEGGKGRKPKADRTGEPDTRGLLAGVDEHAGP
jgi:hypothetical protein